MNIAPMSEPNTMMPGAGRDPERPSRGDVQVVQRVARAALANDEGDAGGDRATTSERHHSVPSLGTTRS